MTDLVRRLTNSGDFYTGTKEQWEQYWKFVNDDNWDAVMDFETGKIPGFSYDP